jgi:hypothetical protein
MPISGVMPLPAAISSSREGGSGGSWKSPCGTSNSRMSPGRARLVRCLETSPSRCRCTVTVIVSTCPLSGAGAAEVIE